MEKYLNNILDLQRLHRKFGIKKLKVNEFSSLHFSYENVSQILNLLNNDDYFLNKAIKQNKIMGTSFHPELSGTTAVHDYFIRLTKNEN